MANDHARRPCGAPTVLVLPAALSVVTCSLGCKTTPPGDMALDRGVDEPVVDVPLDMTPVFDATFEGFPPVDIVFSERRDVIIPDGTPRPLCEGRRGDAGVYCHEENVTPGLGLFCIRYACDADDGGASLDDCCRLVG